MRAFCTLALITFCLNGISLHSYAQEDTGRQPLDPETFPKELEETFSRFQSDRIQNVLSRFISKWEGEVFSSTEQREVMKLTRLMRSKRYRASNGLKNYLKALISAKNQGITESQFIEWHDVVEKMLDDRRDVNQMHQTLTTYFKDRILYASKSKDWFTKNFQFKIGYQDEAPRLLFTRSAHLICATKSDTINIYKAKGNLNLVSQEWKGKEGKVTWERVGKNPNKVYAQLNNHNIRLARGLVKDKSVAFYNKNIKSGAMEGKFKDKVFIAEQDEDSRYPQFRSTTSRYKVEGFFPQVMYKGGFSMEGNSVVGTSVGDHPAVIKVLRNGKRKISAKADRFVINQDQIVSGKTKAKILFKQDSIYHSHVKFKYLDKKQQVKLIKGDKGLAASPFFNSYHNLEIDVDQVIWKINEPIIKMRMTLNSVESAKFFSGDFYQEGRFDKVQGILEYNPLKEIKLYAERINSYRMTLKGLAEYFGIRKSNMKRMLVNLHQKGFLEFKESSGEVIIRDKLIHYVKAKKNLKDYDNLNLKSSDPDSANAELNIQTGDLELSGVSRVNLSDSQRVSIYPSDSQITMKENRNMTFEGEMFAGRFQFFGDGFTFNYDSFKVGMENVDSLRLYYPDEETGRLIPVKNVIEDIYGSVYIDDPNNKSGQVEIPKYPIFDAKEESTVYYEDSNIYNAVYPSDSFYFQIKPFVAKNLDEFERQEIEFDGTFYSAGILPVFDHYITIMPNNSLGFSKRTPPDGFPLYQGKGTGTMEIFLSSKGLRGAGTVDYLPSTTESQQFLFFPDSMNATAESFNIPEEGQNKYPPVTGDKVYSHWLPYKDSMFIQERDPLSVYNEEVTFNGDLILTPQELYGAGDLKFEQAVIGSEALAMQPNSVNTDSASFKLKSEKSNKDPNFYTEDAGLSLDFDKRELNGKTKGEKAAINLEKHNFRTTIKGFNWRIDSQSMYMTTTEDQEISDAFMRSTKKGQDSLEFNTTAAYFDLSNSKIEARNIPEITVADAEIYPSKGTVTIEEGADIETLEDARIIADTSKQYHEFKDVQVNIFGRDDYAAKGVYTYKDRNGQPHPIHFDKIRTDDQKRTVAETKLEDEEGFPLSPRFQFQGKVKLKARRKNLEFSGTLRPSNVEKGFRTKPFQFTDTVQPDSFFIPVSSMVSKGGDSIVSGMYVDTGTHELYNVFLGTKRHPQDFTLFEADGLLHYNYYEGHYVIEKKRNLKQPDSMPYKLIYNDRNGRFAARGPLNIGFKNHDHIEVRTIGKALYKPKDSIHSLDVTMGIDFPFSPEAMKIATDSLLQFAFPLDNSKDNRQVVKDAATYFIDDHETQLNVLNSIRSFGTFVSNEVYQPKFLFTGVNLTWDPSQQAFLDTNQLGLATMHKAAINKQLKGKLMFKLSKDDRRLQFYAGASSGNYYYFDIGQKKCRVFASDIFFNKKVRETAKDFSESQFVIKPLRDRTEKVFFQQSATIQKP